MAQEELIESYRRTPGAHGQSNAVYAAMIQSVDRSVGRILDKLDALQLADRTVVVFTSDNGGRCISASRQQLQTPPCASVKVIPTRADCACRC